MVSNDYQLKRNVCDSLLLNFDKPLKIIGDREFTIPSKSDCESIFIRASKELLGNISGGSEYFSYYALQLGKSKKLNARLSDAIYRSFAGDRDYMNFFDNHILGQGFFDSEFFYGFGTLHRYYPKVKEDALKNIESFFDKKEKESLDKFGILIEKHRDIFWEEHLRNLKKFFGS